MLRMIFTLRNCGQILEGFLARLKRRSSLLLQLSNFRGANWLDSLTSIGEEAEFATLKYVHVCTHTANLIRWKGIAISV